MAYRPRLRLVCLDCGVKVTQHVTPSGEYILVGDGKVHARGRNYLPLINRGK